MFTESNAYFTVPHQFNVYLETWPESNAIPTEEDLRSMQSVGLKLLSEVKELEANCLLQLRQLDNEAKAVVDFLKLQSRKVDLVLQHVLEKEVQSGERYQGTQFGGSGISIVSPAPLPLAITLNLRFTSAVNSLRYYVYAKSVSAKAPKTATL